MKVFLCRLKTSGKNSPNRVKEALERDEIWIGWDVCSLLRMDGSHAQVKEEAKQMLREQGWNMQGSSAPKQIANFLCEAREGGIAVVPDRKGRDLYLAQIPRGRATAMKVPWETTKLPGRAVVWLNDKRPLPASSVPKAVRERIHDYKTFWPFDNDGGLGEWARKAASTQGRTAAVEKDESLAVQERVSRGGFQLNKKQRDAIENLAMKRARTYLDARGYKDIKDVSRDKPGYDFECRSGASPIYVEVKGTSGDGTSLVITAREKKHLAAHKRNSLVLVVHSIQIARRTKPAAKGGKLFPWSADRFLSDWNFTPTQFMARQKL